MRDPTRGPAGSTRLPDPCPKCARREVVRTRSGRQRICTARGCDWFAVDVDFAAPDPARCPHRVLRAASGTNTCPLGCK